MDFPAGVINVVTGRQEELVSSFRMYNDVSAVWLFGEASEKLVKDEAPQPYNAISEFWENGVGHKRQLVWRSKISKPGKDMIVSKLFHHHSVRHKRIWVPTQQSFGN